MFAIISLSAFSEMTTLSRSAMCFQIGSRRIVELKTIIMSMDFAYALIRFNASRLFPEPLLPTRVNAKLLPLRGSGSGYGGVLGVLFLKGGTWILNVSLILYLDKIISLNINMVYREFLLDSSTSLNSSNPTWQVPSSPFVENMKILSVTLPASFYGVAGHNNRIVVKEGSNTFTVILPPGHYNSETFPGQLATTLNSAGTNNNYTVTFNETGRNLTIAATNNFQILALASGTTAYRLIGSKKTDLTPLGTSFTGNTIDLGGTNCVLLSSNSLLSRNSVFLNSQTSNILCMVPLLSPNNSLVYWKNPGSYLNMSTQLTHINIQLLASESMQPLDLNGASFQIHLGYTDDPDDPVPA
jgi:hypothetical protein